jgi:hypothetical protein
MHRPGITILPLVISFMSLGIVACSGPDDEAVIERFFTAARESDRATLMNVALAASSPGAPPITIPSGVITEFDVISASEERREPFSTRALAQAVADAEAEDAAFTERKIEYQEEHMAAIQRVLKAEAENVTLDDEDGEIQREWTTFREETSAHAKMVSDARLRLEDATKLIELSASTLRNPVNGAEVSGEMVTKDVTISAPATMADGQTVETTLGVTLQRAVITGENEIEGRWIVTAVTDR